MFVLRQAGIVDLLDRVRRDAVGVTQKANEHIDRWGTVAIPTVPGRVCLRGTTKAAREDHISPEDGRISQS